MAVMVVALHNLGTGSEIKNKKRKKRKKACNLLVQPPLLFIDKTSVSLSIYIISKPPCPKYNNFSSKSHNVLGNCFASDIK